MTDDDQHLQHDTLQPDEADRVEDEPETIIIGPSKTKPVMRFSNAGPESSELLTRLSSFLPQFKAANDELEQDKLNGKLDKLKMEISSDEEEDGSDEGDDSSSDDSSEEQDSSEEYDSMDIIRNPETSSREMDGDSKTKERRKRRKGPYIEMNLGLGVLEEKKPSSRKRRSGGLDDIANILAGQASSSSSSDEEGGSDDDDGSVEEEGDSTKLQGDKSKTKSTVKDERVLDNLMGNTSVESTGVSRLTKRPRIEEI